MVRMISPDGDIVDVVDSLYDYMLERRFAPYLGSTPGEPPPPGSPADGDVALYDSGAQGYLPANPSVLAALLAANPEFAEQYATKVQADATDTGLAAVELELADRLSEAGVEASIEELVSPVRPGNGNRAVGKSELTFNVMDFGTNVATGGDDTAAFAAACAAAVAVPGRGAEVYVPAGSYKVTSFVLPDNVKLRGAGQMATKITTTTSGSTIEIGVENHVMDLWITAPGIAGAIGITTRGYARHSVLRAVRLTGLEQGIVFSDAFIIQVLDCIIQSCTTGIYFSGVDFGTNAILVMGGEIQGCVNGVTFATKNFWGIRFIAACIEGNSGIGIRVASGGLYSFTVRDSYFESNQGGHIVMTGGNIYGMTVDTNGFFNAAPFAVQIAATVGALRDCKVTNNLFNLTTGGAKPIAIQNSGALRTTVEGNHYLQGATFDPAADYSGTRLIYRETGSLLLPPSAATVSAGGAPLRIPHGTAPTNPVNGDMWTTTAGLYVRINGVTVGPLT